MIHEEKRSKRKILLDQIEKLPQQLAKFKVV